MWDGYVCDGGDSKEIANLIILSVFLTRKLFYWNAGVGYFYYTCDVFDDLRSIVTIRIDSVLVR